MEKQELYLKTIFCCVACDGEIAPQEVKLIRKLCTESKLFEGLDVESYINHWIADINKKGHNFLNSFLEGLSDIDISDEEQLKLVDLAILSIEADSKIEYSEIKFFKKIRSKLSVSDEQILAQHPDKGSFLLPDINVLDDPVWNENTKFEDISLK